MASAEGKWAITEVRMGRRRQQQRTYYLEPRGENVKVLKTLEVSGCGELGNPQRWQPVERTIATNTLRIPPLFQMLH